MTTKVVLRADFGRLWTAMCRNEEVEGQDGLIVAALFVAAWHSRHISKVTHHETG